MALRPCAFRGQVKDFNWPTHCFTLLFLPQSSRMTIDGEALSQRTFLRYNLGSDCVRILLSDIAELEVWVALQPPVSTHG
jgi:hypothetical protein